MITAWFYWKKVKKQLVMRIFAATKCCWADFCRIKAQHMALPRACLCLYTVQAELPVLDKLHQVTGAATERPPQVTANTWAHLPNKGLRHSDRIQERGMSTTNKGGFLQEIRITFPLFRTQQTTIKSKKTEQELTNFLLSQILQTRLQQTHVILPINLQLIASQQLLA